MNEDKTERIRIDLQGSEAKKLNYIKIRRGITINTQLVRALIAEEYMRLGGKEELL